MSYVVDDIGAVVAKCSFKLLEKLQLVDPLITAIHYKYGHYTDIQNELLLESKERLNRYPLVALFEDFAIDRGEEGLDGISNLKIIILHSSQAAVTRGWREENVFRKILYPIYEEFKRQLFLSGIFNVYSADQIKHRQINRPHWGDPGLYKNKDYIFTDVLDGIEMSNLSLESYFETLCIPKTPELGPELVTNGGFNSDANGWILGAGWVYFEGEVKHVSGVQELNQILILTDGMKLRASFNITGDIGFVTAELDRGTAVVFNAGVGDVTFDGKWIGSDSHNGYVIRFKPSNNFNGSIDNVSIKEIL